MTGTCERVSSMPSPPAKSLLAKTGWSGLACASIVLGRFVVTIITARRLGPDGSGRLAYLLWMLEIAVTIAGFGMQSCITRFVADLRGQGRADLAPALARWLYTRYLALTLLGAAGIGIVASQSRVTAGNPAIWISLAIYLVLQAMGNFYLAYLAGQQEFKAIARINLISALALVMGAGFGTLLFGVTGALLGYAASAVAPAVLSGSLLRRTTVFYDSTLASECMRYAFFAWCAAVVSACVWSRVEVAFLENYWGHDAVAMFSVGLTLSALAVQGPLLLGGALMPHFAELAAAGAGVRERLYSGATRLLAALLFPLCLGLSSIIPILLPVVYGEAFRGAIPSAMVLTAFSALAFMNVGSALVYASGKAWFIAATGLGGAILSLAGCLLVIPSWGPWGAALSRSVVQTAMVALGVWYIGKHLGCPAPFASLARILLSAGIAALCSYATITFLPDAAALIVALPFAAYVYLRMLRATRALEPEDLQSIRNALIRIPSSASAPMDELLGWLEA